ncbi:518_t:CDS:2 [Diversispora eburnea]|uniref:518_t:CDS:1 n=1 Tax=Diversispora eburnea TaxID=1213867 RepID=A0A9N8UZT0_9GLOM|nr:518_t:CDS:2 [Diversispora eburnea]
MSENNRIQLSYKHLVELLTLKHDLDPISSQKFYSYSITYFLAFYEDGFQEHLFCNEEFIDISTELLELFSLIEPDESVEKFKKILADQLSICAKCIKTYHLRKSKLRKRNLIVYKDTHNVDKTFSVIDSWDQERVIFTLTKLKDKLKGTMSSKIYKEKSLFEKTRNAVFLEMLINYRLFKISNINSLFVEVYSLTNASLSIEQEFPVGMIIASVHENDFIRKNAWQCMDNFQNIINRDTYDTYKDCVNELIQYLRQMGKNNSEYPFTKKLQVFWKGVRKLLNCLDLDSIIYGFCNETTDFCNLVNSYMEIVEQGSTYIEVGKCFEVLLNQLRIHYWEYSFRPPKLVLGDAFKSEAFMKVAIQYPQQCKHLFEWVPEFTFSLVDNPNFKDIFTDVLEWLLVTFQRITMPEMLALESMRMALTLIRNHNEILEESLQEKLKIIESGNHGLYHNALHGERHDIVFKLLSRVDALPVHSSRGNPIVLITESPSTISKNGKPEASKKLPPRTPISTISSNKTSSKQVGTIRKMREAYVKEQKAKMEEARKLAIEDEKYKKSKSAPKKSLEVQNNELKISSSNKKLENQAPRKAKLLDISEVVTKDIEQFRKQKHRQEKENIKRRLKPNMKSLHKKVLSWNIDATGNVPPNVSQDVYKQIPDTFKSVTEYQQTFEPLLILELWQSFIQNKEEIDENNIYEIFIESSSSVDDFVEISAYSDSPLMYLNENDLMVLREPNENHSRKISESSKNSINSSTKKCLSLINHVSPNKFVMRCCFEQDLVNMRHELRPGSNLTPTAREYAALMAMPYFKFCNLILQPEAWTSSPVPTEEVTKYMNLYKINESQAEAICKVLQKKQGFLLIQGPPGTGKTSTIVSIISALKATSPSCKHRILACAPSNAAVDELERRLSQGIFDKDGNLVQVNVTRFGKNDNTEEVADTVKETNKFRMTELQNSLDEKNRKLRDPTINGWDISTLQADITQINEEIRKLSQSSESRLDQSEKKDRFRKDQELADADIICATLAGSGHDRLSTYKFDTIIIDEAAQAIELCTIIPLKFNVNLCILVGDPNQLPPTVLSNVATQYFYEQSLFNRLQKRFPQSVHMLKTQYRMHPEISKFPSLLFYNSELKNSEGLELSRKQPWHIKSIFAPYKFFEVKGVMTYVKKSYSNPQEAKIAIRLVDRLVRDFPEIDFRGRIGVITPYKGQLSEIKRQFKSQLSQDLFADIEFNTVDGFQGKEKDLIIFSCVRAGEENSVGFLKDLRRLNVALTRARSSLFILGNQRSLERNELWNKLILDSIARNSFIDCSSPEFELYLSAKPGESRPKILPKNFVQKVSQEPAPRSILHYDRPREDRYPPNPDGNYHRNDRNYYRTDRNHENSRRNFNSDQNVGPNGYGSKEPQQLLSVIPKKGF